MGSRVRIRLFHLHFVMDFLFPLLKNSKSGVDDRGHRLRITHTHRRAVLYIYGEGSPAPSYSSTCSTYYIYNEIWHRYDTGQVLSLIKLKFKFMKSTDDFTRMS